MYDINLTNIKKGNKFYYLFFILGLIFLIVIVGFTISNYLTSKELDASTTSTKVVVNSHLDNDGTTMYSPTYYYVVNGQEYTCSSGSSSNKNPGTNNKKVYYEASNPSNCMTEFAKSNNKFLILFIIIPVVFIGLSVYQFRKNSQKIKAIKKLNQTGKLVKNLPYRLENTNINVNGVSIQKIVVDYTLPTGSTITLEGEPRYDHKLGDADGLVDLVIDENDPSNYFLDFEINRLSGNLPTDYYQNPPQVNTQVSSQTNQFNQPNNMF